MAGRRIVESLIIGNRIVERPVITRPASPILNRMILQEEIFNYEK